MAKYTTLVRSICEQKSGLTESTGFNNVGQVISGAIPGIFNFDFPIFDESYRNVLCTKILKHYYMREIGAETVGLWQLWLDRRLNEIMPYYNKLYESELLEFNPLYDVDLTREHNTTGSQNNTDETTRNRTDNDKYSSHTDIENSGEGTGTISSSEDSTDSYSDTPQGSLQNVQNGTYLTNARVVDRSGNQNDSNEYSNTGTTDVADNRDRTENETINKNGTVNSTEEYLETVKGKQGGKSYAEMIKEYRETFLNIDMMVIEELSDLFMNIW